MTDKRAVINPFTKKDKRMRRNTRNTKWIPAENASASSTSRPGPGNTIQHHTPTFHHLGQSATILTQDEQRDKDGIQSRSPELTAVIYNFDDLRDIPDRSPQSSIPSSISWGSLRGSVRKGDMPSSTAGPNVSSPSQDERKDSEVTLFPHFETSIKMTTKGTQTQWNLADIYRNVREIYDIGPEGEGQKLWSTFAHPKKQNKGHTKVGHTQIRETAAPRRPSAPGLSAHPPSAAVQKGAARTCDEVLTTTSSSQVRQDSAVSRTSYEVPAGISPEIRRVVDVSKPLPPKPLPPVPHVVDDSKPLPSVPLLQPAPRSKPQPRSDYRQAGATKLGGTGNKAGYSSSGVQYSTQWRRSKNTGHYGTHKTKVNKSDPWYKPLVNLIPDEHALLSTHRTPNADILKSKISRPRPFTAIQEGRTANVALECGGVGGPAAATHFPNFVQAQENPSPYPARVDLTQPRRSPRERLTARQQGKQKASHEQVAGIPVSRNWRDKLIGPGGSAGKSVKHTGRGRKDSDASFACQGFEPNHGEYVREPGPSRQGRDGDGEGESGWEDESMYPEALFSGTRDGERGERDTRFYQPYVDVLDEYQD
ncbi:hypothetical protein BKA63DRAFT_576825 [Paraphoma chrysanthemicola]|nr:hypothetical protein BKA63DRAFT_576825 [Paraphoma chrysanthemicola]